MHKESGDVILKKQEIIVIVFVLISLILFGFLYKKAPETYSGLGETVSLSPDDKQIVFPYFQDGASSLFIANVDGSNARQLTFAKSNESHIRPAFSHDGSQIAYLSFQDEEEEPKSELHLINADGTNERVLLEGGLVTEAIFSHDDQTIYFLKAGVYTNYSPITGKRPHEFDIYSIDVSGENMKQLTFRSEYDMSSLGVTADGKSLLVETFKDEQSVHLFSLEDPTHFETIRPDGNFGSDKAKDIYDATLSPTDEYIAFMAVSSKSSNSNLYEYELFLMDMRSKQVKQLTHLGSHIGNPAFFHTEEKLLAVQNTNWASRPEKYQLWVMNFEGIDLQKIEISIQ